MTHGSAEDDENRQLTKTVSPLSQETVNVFDRAGRLTSRVADAGSSPHRNKTTAYEYDAAGRVVSTTDTTGVETTTAYDAAGRVTARTVDPGASPHLDLMMSYTYDANGNLTSVEDAEGHVTWYEYDDLNQLFRITDPELRTTTYDYDVAGRQTSSEDDRGVMVTYGYDSADRMTSLSFPAYDGATSGAISYEYDDLDRMRQMTDPTGTTAYEYDAAGRTTDVSSPQGATSYTYDGVGRRASMTMPGSRTVAYEYDDAGALVSLTDWNSQESTFTYDATGRMETMQRPNGLDTLLGYDTAGRLTLVEHAVGTDMIARYAYDLDENGNRDEVAVTGSAVTNDTESYVYDDLDRLTNVSYLSGGSVAYEYDENGNRTQVASGGLTTIYAYDAADQLTSRSGAVSQTYGYDAAGNRVTAGTDEYAWDWNNRLREAEVDSVTSSYTYAGDDLRTSKTVGSTTTSYLWDRAGGLPRVLADGPSTYLWAPDQLVEEVTTANAESYPAADALGSVRARTDDGGSVTGTADWDAFGSARAATGALGAFGWAGEQQDGETGLTYLRSRYYAPGTSRFLSRDTVSPDAAGTNGYAPCAHAADNPATHTDPTSPAIDTAELVHHRIDTA